MSKPTNEPSSEPICKLNGINTSYMFEAVNGVNAKQFEAVNGTNTSYTFEAVNGVNAKQFEAVNGINTSYTFETVSGVNADSSQHTVTKISEGDEISEGVQTPSSMLIVRCNTASLWDSTSRNMASHQDFGHNFASGVAFGHNMVSGLAFGHNFASGVASAQRPR
jgi:hypothetical protein